MPRIKTPTKTITGPQLKSGPSVILIGTEIPGVAELPLDQEITSQKIREMRRDPTIALVRNLYIAPALLSPWSYEETESAPDGASEFIKEQIEPLRTHIIRQVLLGCIDFGWAPFEKIFQVQGNGLVGIGKMKPLLQDWTDIMVDADTGAFLGFRQEKEARYVYIPTEQAFLHAIDVEGTYWYGQGIMPNAEVGYDNWNNVNDAASRYDTKVAGSHWVVHYPIGTSEYQGKETDNEEIARSILGSLQASGGIAVPKALENFIADLSEKTPNAWEIELISDSGTSSESFTDRQKYYDILKVRAYGFPERSILEGQHGTKAEAETHSDFAIASILLRTDDCVRDLNWHVVNQLLRVNWGPDAEGSVYINSGVLDRQNREFLQTLYSQLLTNPYGFTEEFENIDRTALRDLLEVPTDEESVADEERLNDAIRRTGRRGANIRLPERGAVGRYQQPLRPVGNNGTGDVGDSQGNGTGGR